LLLLSYRPVGRQALRRDGHGSQRFARHERALPRRLIVGITGASGSIFGIRLLERLRDLDVETHLVLSRWGARTLVHETNYTVEQVQRWPATSTPRPDQGAPISSGSFVTMGMIVLPCSVKTMAEIAHGTGDTLIPSRCGRGA
jgi:4-hydroxy-3-polyprenylbenzoate decarboxylase